MAKQTIGDAIQEFMSDIKTLPPEEQQELRQAFFGKYIMGAPGWKQAGLADQRALAQMLQIPPSQVIPQMAGQGEIRQPPGLFSRALGRAGGLVPAAATSQEGFAPWARGVSNVMTLGAYPFALGGEAIDTALDPLRRGGRPLNAWTTGQQAEMLAYVPQVWRALLRAPGGLTRFVRGLQRNIEANRAGALVDPVLPKMLPAGSPFALPAGTPPPPSGTVGAMGRPRLRYGPGGLSPAE